MATGHLEKKTMPWLDGTPPAKEGDFSVDTPPPSKQGSTTADYHQSLEDLKNALRTSFGRAPWFENSINTIPSETVQPFEYARKFSESMQKMEAVQKVLGDQRWYLEHVIPHLLDPSARAQNLVIGNDGFVAERVGKGGMGEVWRIVWNGTQKVMKINRSTSDNAPERFAKEIAVHKKMEGEGVPRFVDSGNLPETQGQYFVMDEIPGWTLDSLLSEAACKRLPQQLSYDLLTLVAANLHAVHQKKIIHRDLKPSNIIIDPEGRVWLIDFGLKGEEEHSGTRMTKSFEVMGTAEYIAPEQVNTPQMVGREADIYSFACIAHKCMTGQPPFISDSPQKTLSMQSDKNALPDMSAFMNDPLLKDDVALQKLQLEALDKDPDTRASLDKLLTFFFERSSLKSRFKTAHALLATPHDKRTLPKGSIPSAGDIPASSLLRQGGLHVPSAPVTLATFEKFYEGYERRYENKGPWLTKRKLLGGGAVLSAIVLATAIGVGVAMHGKQEGDPDNVSKDGQKNGPDKNGQRDATNLPMSIANNGEEITFFPNDPKKRVEWKSDSGFFIWHGKELVGSLRPFTEAQRSKLNGLDLGDGIGTTFAYQILRKHPDTNETCCLIDFGDMTRLLLRGEKIVAIYEKGDQLPLPLVLHANEKLEWGKAGLHREFAEVFKDYELQKKDIRIVMRGEPLRGTIYKDFKEEQILDAFLFTLNQMRERVGKRMHPPRGALQLEPDHLRDLARAGAVDVMARPGENMEFALRNQFFLQKTVRKGRHPVG